jgi:uncharacterized RDD family membrane protein YckC
MTKASYGKRVVALLLDWLFAVIPPLVVLVIGIAMVFSDSTAGIGVLFILIGSLGWIVLSIWNKVFKEGRTGQSFGKARMNISLVDANTGQPIGAGRAFLREFIFSLLSSFTAGVFWIVDYLWPLWDKNGERLMDKIMTSRVVPSQPVL